MSVSSYNSFVINDVELIDNSIDFASFATPVEEIKLPDDFELPDNVVEVIDIFKQALDFYNQPDLLTHNLVIDDLSPLQEYCDDLRSFTTSPDIPKDVQQLYSTMINSFDFYVDTIKTQIQIYNIIYNIRPQYLDTVKNTTSSLKSKAEANGPPLNIFAGKFVKRNKSFQVLKTRLLTEAIKHVRLELTTLISHDFHRMLRVLNTILPFKMVNINTGPFVQIVFDNNSEDLDNTTFMERLNTVKQEEYIKAFEINGNVKSLLSVFTRKINQENLWLLSEFIDGPLSLLKSLVKYYTSFLHTITPENHIDKLNTFVRIINILLYDTMDSKAALFQRFRKDPYATGQIDALLRSILVDITNYNKITSQTKAQQFEKIAIKTLKLLKLVKVNPAIYWNYLMIDFPLSRMNPILKQYDPIEKALLTAKHIEGKSPAPTSV